MKIKCKKCGCEMSTMSESCPMCGTPTHEESNVENKLFTTTQDSTDSCIFKGLVEALKENLELQMKYNNEVSTMVDYSAFMDENGDICAEYDYMNIDLQSENIITSALFSSNGDELTPSIHTNLPHLVVYFSFNDEQLQKFRNLSVASQFVQLDEDGRYKCFVDCYSDVEMAAKLYSIVLQGVFGTAYDAVSEYSTQVIGFITLKDEQKRLMKNAKVSIAIMSAIYSLPSDDTLLQNVYLKVNDYNKKAKEYGYEAIEIDKSHNLLSGIFIPKEYSANMGVMAKTKLDFRNGDMAGDFEAICKLLKQ